MDQRTNPVGLAQQIVGRDRLAGRQDVHADSPLSEQRQRLRANLQHPEDSHGEYDDFGAVFEQLDDVRRLNAGIVAGASLAPVPSTRAARVELGVLDGAVAVDADPAPAAVGDVR
jgi:hypothetical protein